MPADLEYAWEDISRLSTNDEETAIQLPQAVIQVLQTLQQEPVA